MKRSRVDIAVGVFVILGILALGWLSIRLGKVEFLSGSGYTVTVGFPLGGRPQDRVDDRDRRRARSGRVTVDPAWTTTRPAWSWPIETGMKLTEDSIASIKTKGLIGEKFIQISPGGSDKVIKPNGKITEVEPPIDLEELLSKYVFGKV